MEAPTGLIWRVLTRTPRLEYVLEVLFTKWLGISHLIVSAEEWPSFQVPTGWRVIAYGTEDLGPADMIVPYSGFIAQAGTSFILPPWDEKGFFPGEGSFPYDLPASAFYVLTLYPLYQWPYGYDEWGVYAWHKAPFYTAPFWERPFLLLQAYELLERMELYWPRPAFRWEIGWDIDHLFAYRGRGGLRWWMGGIRRGDLTTRLRVRRSREPDPYDTIHSITALFSPSNSRFFFLLSQRHPRDSLISPRHPALRETIQLLDRQGFSVGIHPSFTTRDEPGRLVEEKQLLESYLQKPVTQSRQHYLRFWWPTLMTDLVQAGIQHDFTLAFPRRSGFLLGTTLPVPAYRADREQPLPLFLHSPVLMDRAYIDTSPPDEVEREVERLLRLGKEVGGTLHFIWHNSTWAKLPLPLFPTS